MDDAQEQNPIVIDNGSQNMRFGYSNSNYNKPNLIKSMVGIPKRGIIEHKYCKSNYSQNIIPDDILNIISNYYWKNIYIGNEIKSLDRSLNISYPIKDGLFINWDHIV